MLGAQEASMKSIRPYKSSEEYLYAMKEDLAEWLKDLYGLDVDVESFLDILETGVLLCHHAENVTRLARDLTQEYPVLPKKIHLPSRGVSCNDFAQPGTFQARDNVSNFIHWCRKEMAITDVLMFETEDLVLRKNEKNFVLCLLEVARQASRFGMSAPTLVQMEEEIEDEIREELKLPREELPLPKPPRRPPDFKNLDQMVQHLVSRCTCPVQFSMIKVTDGKYRVGDSNTLIFVRILRKHVMVRVGGGWDTLEHYLDKHDPCRCTSLSHKQALKTVSPQKPQAAQVQHEITARFTPGTDPRKVQPTFIVRRSQSPLPPVEWRTYVPHSLSPRRRVPSSSEMSHDSNESGRKKEGHLTLQDSSESRTATSVRGRERPATPLGRPPATQEERPRSRQSLLRRSGTPCESSSPLQKVATEEDVLSTKSLQGPCHSSIQVTVNSQEAEGENSTSSSTIRASLTSGRPRLELKLRPPTPTRSSSPCKHFQTSSKQVPEVQIGGQVSGVPQGDRWRKAINTGRSLTPVKQLCHVQKEESDTKGPGNVGLMSYRPLTPSQSYGGSLGLRKAGNTMAKGQEPKVEFGSQKDVRKTCDGFPERAGFGINRLDLKLIRKDSQGLLGQKGGPDSSWKDGTKSHGDTKERLVEKERVYTPLPINMAEEQALYRSLEDEIMANIKELESSDEVHHLLKGSQLRRLGVEHELGRDTMELTCNVSRLLSTPNFPSWPDTKKALDFREGVPRSGVYVPEGETRWLPAGPGYEAVIQELSMALRQEHVGTSPTRSSSLRSGNPTPKEVLTKKAAQEEETTPIRTGDDGSLPTTDKRQEEEVNLNGDATQATSSPATNSSESFATLENMELPLSKPRRSLKKPERVPSIYKLKLRPKIRPRRDHRPEKKPSRIPTPVSYRHVRRTSSVRSQTRTPQKCSTKQRATTETQNSKVEDLSIIHDGVRTMTKEETGASDDEDSWV